MLVVLVQLSEKQIRKKLLEEQANGHVRLSPELVDACR